MRQLGPMASHPSQAATNPVQPIPSHSQIDRSTWDPRWGDGSQKGDGFLGDLVRPDGGVMSEFSMADSNKLRDPKLARKDNPEGLMEYPSIVPTLTPEEVSFVLNMRDGDRMPPVIAKKAEAFALQRQSQGRPLFAQPGEQRYDIAPQLRRKQ